MTNSGKGWGMRLTEMVEQHLGEMRIASEDSAIALQDLMAEAQASNIKLVAVISALSKLNNINTTLGDINTTLGGIKDAITAGLPPGQA